MNNEPILFAGEVVERSLTWIRDSGEASLVNRYWTAIKPTGEFFVISHSTVDWLCEEGLAKHKNCGTAIVLTEAGRVFLVDRLFDCEDLRWQFLTEGP